MRSSGVSSPGIATEDTNISTQLGLAVGAVHLSIASSSGYELPSAGQSRLAGVICQSLGYSIEYW
jgi:hypothetical protein